MKTVRNILALIVSLLVGSLLNRAIIKESGSIIPLPTSVDPEDINSIIENMPYYESKHFIMPFIAHALGSFVGALLASVIAADNKKTYGLIIGCFFLVGGIMVSFQLPAPAWFEILDVIVAYIPMGLLGAIIGTKLNPN